MWQMIGELIGGMMKNSSSSKQQTTFPMMGDMGMGQDRGFYGHMTVKKASKGVKVPICGRGDKD